MSFFDWFRRRKWRPIDSAPRDGRPLLLAWYDEDWDVENDCEIGTWVIVTGQFGSFSIFGHGGDRWCDNAATQCVLPQRPVLWMDLPRKPKKLKSF